MFYPAKQIVPYDMWVGSKRDSANLGAAKRHDVCLIVNCTKNLPFVVPGVARVRIPVDDHPDDAGIMALHLPRAVAHIDKCLSRGKGVLVHCHAGISRSASVAAAYLMHKEGLTPQQAMARIKRLKSETFTPAANFLPALRTFHEITKKQATTASKRATRAPP